MTTFDPKLYYPPLAALWAVDRLPELGPGQPNEAVRGLLEELTLPRAFPHVKNVAAAKACLAGLWLYHDFLDESHTISQDLDDWFGSYWHGIMHRREPDPSNAKYWFRRVPSNPVYEALAQHLGCPWDPFAFVDRCERARGSDSAEEADCRRVQLAEMRLLSDWCYRAAGS